jgi:ABC-type phosphate transport system auxiliary subunit
MANSDVITGVRQAVQDFVAPGIQELRGEIKALDARISALERVNEARFSAMNTKFDSLSSEMNTKFDALSSELNTKLDSVNSRLDSRFSEVNTKLDAILNLHDLQVRISKLESQRTA